MSLRHRKPGSSIPQPTTAVSVAIDGLSLHGLSLSPARAERVRAALATELSSLVAIHGTEALTGRPPATAPPALRIRAADSPESIARALAQRLMRLGAEREVAR
jgi:hypothetical protein